MEIFLAGVQSWDLIRLVDMEGGNSPSPGLCSSSDKQSPLKEGRGVSRGERGSAIEGRALKEEQEEE